MVAWAEKSTVDRDGGARKKYTNGVCLAHCRLDLAVRRYTRLRTCSVKMARWRADSFKSWKRRKISKSLWYFQSQLAAALLLFGSV